MNKPSRESLDAYFARGDSWANDQRDALLASRRLAWIVALAALAVVVLEGLALVLLMPMKTVVPYTLLVDRQTGFVQALKPLDAQLVSSEAALTQSFLAQYVIAREGFDINSLQRDYRKVALWSEGDARNSYVANMQAANPNSPLARYPRSTIVDVQVKTVTPLSKTAGMVRFQTIRRDASGNEQPAQQWMVVVSFHYSGAPMTVSDRIVNPLGFQVARYHRSAETIPSAQPAQMAVSPQTEVPVQFRTITPTPPLVANPSKSVAPVFGRMSTAPRSELNRP